MAFAAAATYCPYCSASAELSSGSAQPALDTVMGKRRDRPQAPTTSRWRKLPHRRCGDLPPVPLRVRAIVLRQRQTLPAIHRIRFAVLDHQASLPLRVVVHDELAVIARHDAEISVAVTHDHAPHAI